MQYDNEDLMEHVLQAVMQTDADALSLAIHLRRTVPEARVLALIAALLSADVVIRRTFNGASPGRSDAKLARAFALILAEAGDEMEAAGNTPLPLTLSDLTL